MNNLHKVLIITLVALMLSGCAHFVTDKNLIDKATDSVSTPTKYFDLTIEFAAPPAMNNNEKYYVVLFTTANANIHYITKDWTPFAYFITPVDSGPDYDKQKVRDAYTLADDDLTPLYETYFRSWQSIYTYDATYRLRYYPGPYQTTANQGVQPKPTMATAYVLSDGSNQMNFKIPIPQDNFYFQVFAVNGSKILIDNLDSHGWVEYVDNRSPVIETRTPGSSDGLGIKKYVWRTYEN